MRKLPVKRPRVRATTLDPRAEQRTVISRDLVFTMAEAARRLGATATIAIALEPDTHPDFVGSSVQVNEAAMLFDLEDWIGRLSHSMHTLADSLTDGKAGKVLRELQLRLQQNTVCACGHIALDHKRRRRTLPPACTVVACDCHPPPRCLVTGLLQ